MDVLERLGREKKVVLFGQEDYLARVESYLETLFPEQDRTCISFGLKNDRPDSTEFDFTACRVDFNELRLHLVLVVFSNKFKNDAEDYLKVHDVKDFLSYDSVMDNLLKKKFFKAYFRDINRSFILLKEVPVIIAKKQKKVHIYQAVSIYDKHIDDRKYETSSYLIPIQVGAALTDKRIAILCDNVGDNISERNRRYSEMTAFYWMWKNDKVANYLGICHYRRLWKDLDKIAIKIVQSDIDAVLPLPTLCKHSVHEDYLLKHIPSVWRPMMDILKKRSPDYWEAAQEIFQGRIFFASNMCILSREVLDDLCEWMFPIVSDVEDIIGDINDSYYNRYAGFCTERLITLYFLYNKHKWKIAYTEKVFVG